jgi:hypothetical protein
VTFEFPEILVGQSVGVLRSGEWEGNGKVNRGDLLTHIKGFKVFADFGDELFTALVALREAFIGCVGLGEGEKGEGGACEGKEVSDVLCRRRAWLYGLAKAREQTFSTLPRSCIWLAVRDEDQMGSAS